MTDLSSLSADQLAEKVREHARQALGATRPTALALLDVHASLLSDLRDRASERDQAVRERDEHLAHLASEEDAYCRQRELRIAAEQRADRLAAALERFHALACDCGAPYDHDETRDALTADQEQT